MTYPTSFHWRKLILLSALLGATGVANAADVAAPSVAPATARDAVQSYQPGLVAEIYQLPVRPRGLRNPIPGLAPTSVKIAVTPDINAGADLDGISGSVQAEFAGEIWVPASGQYTFSASADDAMDLQIAGKTVLSNAWINGNNAPTVATVRLNQGWQPIRVRYFQGDGGFNLNLRWQPPDAATIVDIPAAQFRVSRAQVALSQQKKSVDAFAESADAARAHRFVFRSKGFYELPESDGDLLIEILEGPTIYSASARKDFANLVSATKYESLPYWHQVMVLAGFVRGWHTESTDRGPVALRAIYQLSAPRPVEYEGWNGAKRQGFENIVTIGAQKFTIYTPAADSPERENVAEAIAGLPASLRVMLKRVKVEPYGTANEFNGGGDEIWVRRGEVTTLPMLDDTLSHEIGHILMNQTDSYLLWQRAVAQDVASVSHYGRLNASEDFAEFVRLFLSTRDDAAQINSLRQIFPARTSALESVLQQVNFSWELVEPQKVG